MANVYANFVKTIQCRMTRTKPSALDLDFPNVEDGLRGMLFLETLIASDKSKQKWTKIKK